MPDTHVHPPGAVSRFFTNYLSWLDKASVPEKRRRWYVKRIEAVINAQNRHRIKHLRDHDTDQYFAMQVTS